MFGISGDVHRLKPKQKRERKVQNTLLDWSFAEDVF